MNVCEGHWRDDACVCCDVALTTKWNKINDCFAREQLDCCGGVVMVRSTNMKHGKRNNGMLGRPFPGKSVGNWVLFGGSDCSSFGSRLVAKSLERLFWIESLRLEG